MKQPHEVLSVKIVGGLQEASTPWAGVSLMMELFYTSAIYTVANKALLSKSSSRDRHWGVLRG